MELSPSWESANCAATQELPSILWNPKVQYRTISLARSIQSIPSHPISLRSILILPTHLRLGLPSGFLRHFRMESRYEARICARKKNYNSWRWNLLEYRCPPYILKLRSLSRRKALNDSLFQRIRSRNFIHIAEFLVQATGGPQADKKLLRRRTNVF
jgi:hypothetical protein